MDDAVDPELEVPAIDPSILEEAIDEVTETETPPAE